MKLLILTALVLIGCPAFSQTVPPNSVWENERGSELRVGSVGSDGAFSGTYINRAAGFECQGTSFEVSGWVEEDKITFSVRWKNSSQDCRSITSWIGYRSGDRLLTDWILVYTDSDEQRPILYKGTDFFALQTVAQ